MSESSSQVLGFWYAPLQVDRKHFASEDGLRLIRDFVLLCIMQIVSCKFVAPDLKKIWWTIIWFLDGVTPSIGLLSGEVSNRMARIEHMNWVYA